MTYRAPKGTGDILPPASEQWRRLLRFWDELSERYGYGFIMTPIFESTEVFARGVGRSTEVVQKQMYTFQDKAGRSLTMRPEMTASVVRAYLELGLRGVFKAAYSGPMFRYEQPQAGRKRQFYQLGVEYLAEAAPQSDVEVIEVGYRFLEGAGLSDVSVPLNSIGDPVCRPAYRERLVAYLEERRTELDEDCQRRIADNPLRVLDCRVDVPKLSDAPSPVEALCEPCAEHIEAVQTGLKELGIPFEPAPRLVRGLDYYTRTVFEYVSPRYEVAQDSLGGGGRYDGLAEALGGPPTPGVGVSLGLDRIVLALGDQAIEPKLDVFVILAESGRRSEAFRLMSRLRSSGLRVDADLGQRSVKAQFRTANRRKAAGAVVVGEEWDEDKVTARDLVTGDQRLIPVEEVEEWARSR
ncbi:MAG: histidine--tRNA ligase [Acidimicrobiia bacterium]